MKKQKNPKHFNHSRMTNSRLLKPCSFTFYRYFAIISPMHNHASMKRTRYSLIIVWIVSVIFAGPFLYLYKFRYLPDRTYGIKPYCTTHSPTFKILTLFEDNQLFQRIKHLGSKLFVTSRNFYIFATMMYQFAIPLLYLSFAYARMSMAMTRNPVPGDFNLQPRGLSDLR